MTDMREVEKSEISHTNAIILRHAQTDERRSSLQPRTRPAFGATLWLNWQAAIGHFTRFFVTEPRPWLVGTDGKTGIGALEDVGNIA